MKSTLLYIEFISAPFVGCSEVKDLKDHKIKRDPIFFETFYLISTAPWPCNSAVPVSADT